MSENWNIGMMGELLGWKYLIYLALKMKKLAKLDKHNIYKQGNGEYWLRFHHLRHGEWEFTTWHLMSEIWPYDPRWKLKIVGLSSSEIFIFFY